VRRGTGHYPRRAQRIFSRCGTDDRHRAAILVLVHTYHLSAEHPARERCGSVEVEPHGASCAGLSGHFRQGCLAPVAHPVDDDPELRAVVSAVRRHVRQTHWWNCRRTLIGSIWIKCFGKAYRQYPTHWSRLAEWVLPGGRPRHLLRWVLKIINIQVY